MNQECLKSKLGLIADGTFNQGIQVKVCDHCSAVLVTKGPSVPLVHDGKIFNIDLCNDCRRNICVCATCHCYLEHPFLDSDGDTWDGICSKDPTGVITMEDSFCISSYESMRPFTLEELNSFLNFAEEEASDDDE